MSELLNNPKARDGDCRPFNPDDLLPAESSFAEPHSSAVDDALRLAEGSPVKDHAWMTERAGPMCKHCLAGEDVYAAAARILAEQARWYKAEYEAWRAAYARDRKPNTRTEPPPQATARTS